MQDLCNHVTWDVNIVLYFKQTPHFPVTRQATRPLHFLLDYVLYFFLTSPGLHQNEHKRDIFGFAENTMKLQARNVLEYEIVKLGSVKASFGLEVKFKRETRNAKGEMVEEKHRHYFKEDPHVFTKANFKETFNQKFNEFVDRIKGEIESLSERGCGW